MRPGRWAAPAWVRLWRRVHDRIVDQKRALSEQRARWPLWLPVAFGVGIASYFTLPAEPPIAPVIGVAAVAAALCWMVRGTAGLRWTAALVLAALLGIAMAGIRTASTDTTMLRSAQWAVVTGTLERVEKRPTARRLTLSDVRLSETRSTTAAPERVRIVLRDPDAVLMLGSRIRLRARLRPPPPPATPGGFAFRRWAYFQGLGAVGFAVGQPVLVSGLEDTSWRLAVERTRRRVADRVMRAMPGEAGPIAAALLVGERSAITPETASVFRQSGLAHLLAISGLHMGMVACMIFFTSRLVLSGIPALALRRPIKKWAAVVSLIGSAGYLLLAGAPVPTQRAFMMTGVALTAVLVDREVVSLRLVAWAALAVLAISPEALVGPSFQLSFAAATALVAVYENWQWRRPTRLRGRSPATAWIRHGWRYAAGIVATSGIAGLATAPFVAFHFQMVSHVGLFANLLAVPITGLVTMPAGLLAVALMPFGADQIPLAAMEFGIGATLEVAERAVAVFGRGFAVSAAPPISLTALVIGGCWLAIWQGPVRWIGGVPVAAAVLLWVTASPPHVLVSGQGGLVAVAMPSGTWAISTQRAGRYQREVWRRRWGIERFIALRDAEADFADAVACDDLGCILLVGDRRIGIAQSAAASVVDCPLVDLLITGTRVQQRCSGTLIIDRAAVRRGGSHAIWLDGEAVTVAVVEGRQRDGRPWEGEFSDE